MKLALTLLAFLCVASYSSNAQDTLLPTLRKMDLNLYMNVVTQAETNYSKDNKEEHIRVGAVSGLFAIYPLDYKRNQFGLAFGFESVVIHLMDTLSITENRIPLLAVVKFNFLADNAIYMKAQLGTAITLESTYNITNKPVVINDRTEIGVPILANIGFGATLPINQIGIGLEVGYSFKQLGYKQENRYESGAVFLGVLASFP